MEEWHDHPLLIEAFAEKLRAGWTKACEEHGARLPVLFTAHSVPTRTITEGDPYEAQTRETAALVAKQVPEIGDWRFAFQSQGMSGGEWLGPTVEDTIKSLQKRRPQRRVSSSRSALSAITWKSCLTSISCFASSPPNAA